MRPSFPFFLFLGVLLAGSCGKKGGADSSPKKDGVVTPSSRGQLTRTRSQAVLPVATKDEFTKEFGRFEINFSADIKALREDPDVGHFVVRNAPALMRSVSAQPGAYTRMMRCLGIASGSAVDLFDTFYLFSDGEFTNTLALFETNVSASRFVACRIQEDSTVKEVRLHGAVAMESGGTTFTALTDKLLVGVRGSFARRRLDQGTLLRGGARAFFGPSGSVARLSIVRFPLTKKNQGLRMLVGEVKELGIEGVATLNKGLFMKISVDLETPANATRLVTFVKPLITTPKVQQSLKQSGIDPVLRSAFSIESQGREVLIKLSLPVPDLKKVMRSLAKKHPPKGAKPTP